MHIPSSRGGVAALGAALLLLLSAPDAGARRCASIDTEIQLSNGTIFSGDQSPRRAFFGPRCWDPIPFATTIHLNGSRGCPTDSGTLCTESLSGCGDFDATAALAAGTFVGKLMLIERGGCSFALKAVSAADAGASGLLIFSDSHRNGQAMQDNGGACVGNECPGDAENLAIPTLMIEADEGAMMIADPALLANVLWDCPGTPAEAQCGSLAPTLAPTSDPTTRPSISPTTSHPTTSPTTSDPTTSPTTSPSISPTTSDPTTSPTTSAPTSDPTSSPSVYAGPTLQLQLSIATETLNVTQIADLEAAVESLFATAAAAVVPPVFATADPRVLVQPGGVVSIALLNLNGAGIDFDEVRAVALQLDGASTDNITDDSIGTSFGSFQVSASTAMPAPTAPPTASPSPSADAPAPEASDTGLDSTTVVIIVVGTIIFLLVTLNLVFFFMYKQDDSAHVAQSYLTTAPSEHLTTAQRKADLARDLNAVANASLPRSPHFYPGSPGRSDGYSISGSSFGGNSTVPTPAAATDGNQHNDQNGQSSFAEGRGSRVSFAEGRGYAPAQQRQSSIGGGGAGRAPNQWYPGGATANNKKKRSPKKDKLQQPGQSVLARVGAQPWSFDSSRR